MKNLLKTTILAATLLIVGCKKEKGPKGDPGTNGNNGINGKDGVNGTNGINGNANVLSSSISVSSWGYYAPDWTASLSYPAITQSILDKGAVLVYMESNGIYFQLPFTIYPLNSYSRTYNFTHKLNSVTIYVTDSDLTQPTNPGSKKFKVVCIAAGSKPSKKNINYKDYNDVKEAYGLN
jgi:hypothetical protein